MPLRQGALAFFGILALAGLMGLLGPLILLREPTPVEASFHCMRIHGVMAGFNGNGSIQYVELRMNAGGQIFVGGFTIKFYDAAGTLKATFTFPSSVTNGSTGDSILVGTQEFNTNTPGGDADFTFTSGNTVASNGGDALHPVQAPGGKVRFADGFDNCDADFVAGPGEVDTLAYGGASADFGSAAVALPSPSDNTALRLGNLNLTPSNNSTEYSLNTVSASTFSVASGNLASDLTTPRNNGRTVLQITETAQPTPTPTASPTPTATATSGATPTPTPTSTGDSDGDGFSDDREAFLGTDPSKKCAATPTADDEPPPDAWPFDFNDDQKATLPDVLKYIPVFNTFPPGPPYADRFNLNAVGGITLSDVLLYIPVFNTACV